MRSFTLLAVVLGCCNFASAAFIVQPSDATASHTYNSATTGAQFSRNGLGFDESERALVETGDSIPITWPTHDNGNVNQHWHAGGQPAPVTIDYALPGTFELQGMHLWNLNMAADPDRSIRQATVAVSLNGVDFTDVTISGLDANGYFLRAPGESTYAGEDYLFTATAQFVRFTITSNWNNTATYVGISEVRFLAIPEPASLLFAGLGGSFLLLRRKQG